MCITKKLMTVSSLVLLLSSGCFWTSTMHTARVLAPGETSIAVGGMSIPNADGFLPVINYRQGLSDRFDIGLGMDALNTAKVDFRAALLKSEESGIDLSVEMGSALLLYMIPSYYFGVGVSAKLGAITPYLHYRISGVTGRTDAELNDDIDDSDFIISVEWDQITAGAQIDLSDTMAIIGEVSRVIGIEDASTNDDVTHVSVGIVLKN